MLVNKRIIDKNVLLSIMYMHETARARRIPVVGMDLFVYSLVIPNREYVEDNIGQATTDELVAALSSGMNSDIQSDVALSEITFSSDVATILAGRIRGGGVMSCMFEAILASDRINGVVNQCGVSMDDIQNGVATEAMLDTHIPASAAKSIVQPSGDDQQTPARRRRNKSLKGLLKKNEQFSSFCTDLTEMAREGRLPSAYGREVETSRVILTLLRKTKGNVLLIGEPGVGKTAIVERLAQMVVDEKVPPKLQGYTIFSVDVAGIQAGTNLRGMLEDKVKSFMEEISNREDVIVFIDEIHMAVGSGGDHGAVDIANMIKPYLARGNVKCIGATTIDDYNKFMRKDGAFCRRFQRIAVDEMTPEQTLDILRNCQEGYEDYHGVSILEDAMESVIRLAKRFIPDRKFPDKALDCIDDACARASLYESKVDSTIIEESVSALSSIPIHIVRASAAARIAEARTHIPTEILGNDKAVKLMCDTLALKIGSKQSNNRPLCTMIVYGPRGVGKKSAVRLLSNTMNGEQAIIEMNGSEFIEPHSVSSIIGAPAGYVGYGDEGRLYHMVKKKPHCLIMVTNFELMHPVVRSQFVRIIKEGIIEDAKGSPIDFRSCMLVFVSDEHGKNQLGFGSNNTSYDLERNKWACILDEIDAEIKFDPVGVEDMKRIARMEAAAFEESVAGAIELREANISEAYSQCSSAKTPSDLRRMMRRQLEKVVVSTI